MCSRARRVSAIAAGVAMLVTLGAAAQQPKFGTRVDVVAVDVNVIGNDGRPVRGLKETDFSLTVDGKPRRVTSVSYLADAPATPVGKRAAVEPTSGRDSTTRLFSSNEGTVAGRLILLLIDQDNIRSGGARAVMDAARRFIDALPPADRVGVFALPAGPSVEMTADRDKVRAVLGKIVGRQTPVTLSKNIGLSEAFGIDAGDQDALTRATARECAGLPDHAFQACQVEVESAGRSLALVTRERTRQSLEAIRQVLARLGRIEGPKHVVLISQSLVAGTSGADLSDFTFRMDQIARECAASRVTLFALRLEQPLVEMSNGAAPPTAAADQQMQAEGLGSLAAAARGGLFNVAGSGQDAFERLTRELAGHYLLGFEAEGSDRDGQAHRIDVQVARHGVEVRSRREFVFAAMARETDEAALARVLGSPFLATDIPLRVATYAVRHPQNSKIRLVISADIARNVEGPQPMTIAFVVFDAKGKSVSSALQRVTLSPRHAPGPLGYVISTTVEPGDYTVRFGVRDAAGGTGSVEHKAVARLTGVPPIETSDLLLADEDPSQPGQWQPSVGGRASGEMSGYLELYSGDKQALGKAAVRFEVAEDDAGPALVTGEARPAGPPDKGRRAVTAHVHLDELPPGTYVARALVVLGDRTLGRVVRPFVVAPDTEPHATASRSDRTLPFADLARAFNVREVLAPRVLTPFLDRLTPPGTAAMPAPLEAAVEQAKHGAFDAGFDKRSSSRDLTTTFLHGLGLLSHGDLDGAAGEFRAALQISSDFFPAAFYLGACYAAGGHDREAFGAWQTTLAGESDAQIAYLMSFDALARLDDWRQALDVARDGLSQWPDEPQLQRREVAALVMTGADAEALEALRGYLARSTGDPDVLFLAMRLLVRSRLGADGGSPDLGEFERYARLYAQANGQREPLVALWEKYLKGQ